MPLACVGRLATQGVLAEAMSGAAGARGAAPAMTAPDGGGMAAICAGAAHLRHYYTCLTSCPSLSLPLSPASLSVSAYVSMMRAR